jgi:hypothetical protein
LCHLLPWFFSDRGTSAPSRLQARAERPTACLSRQGEAQSARSHGCDRFGGRPSPTQKGWRINGGSHGDDMDSHGVVGKTPSLVITNPKMFKRPYWPGYSLPREINTRSPGVSPGPAECGLESKGDPRPNPIVGVLRPQTEEELKREPHAFEYWPVSHTND